MSPFKHRKNLSLQSMITIAEYRERARAIEKEEWKEMGEAFDRCFLSSEFLLSEIDMK